MHLLFKRQKQQLREPDLSYPPTPLPHTVNRHVLFRLADLLYFPTINRPVDVLFRHPDQKLRFA
ncbi:hypothetical protein SXCC_00167 [Gluconacetobacter sp. SXCC-1]|nr:hypothetical protein SXCC_00167 [Gluconacetobacter sp. SXCC-1]